MTLIDVTGDMIDKIQWRNNSRRSEENQNFYSHREYVDELSNYDLLELISDALSKGLVNG